MPIPRLAPIIKAFVSFGLSIGVIRRIISAYIRRMHSPPLGMRELGPFIPRGPKGVRNFTCTFKLLYRLCRLCHILFFRHKARDNFKCNFTHELTKPLLERT